MTHRRGPHTSHARALLAPRLASLFVGLPSGCSATAPENLTRVMQGRVLAVVAEPPEVRPGEAARLRAVLAWPIGSTAATFGVDAWHLCSEPRIPGSHGTAPSSCLTTATTPLASDALETTALLPTDACRNFGPDPPPGGFRPQDPDVTGGYYQPIRLDAFGQYWFHFQRLHCPLGNAPTDAAAEFSSTYAANQNPTPSQLTVNGVEFAFDDALFVRELSLADAPFELSLIWHADPRETYPRFNPASRSVEVARETVSVTWLSNAGEVSFEEPNFVSEPNRQAVATWAPGGDVTHAALWSIVRDSRGAAVALRLDAIRP